MIVLDVPDAVESEHHEDDDHHDNDERSKDDRSHVHDQTHPVTITMSFSNLFSFFARESARNNTSV